MNTVALDSLTLVSYMRGNGMSKKNQISYIKIVIDYISLLCSLDRFVPENCKMVETWLENKQSPTSLLDDQLKCYDRVNKDCTTLKKNIRRMKIPSFIQNQAFTLLLITGTSCCGGCFLCTQVTMDYFLVILSIVIPMILCLCWIAKVERKILLLKQNLKAIDHNATFVQQKISLIFCHQHFWMAVGRTNLKDLFLHLKGLLQLCQSYREIPPNLNHQLCLFLYDAVMAQARCN